MTKKNHILLYGAHMSVSGGFEKALTRGESIQCTAIQLFTKSNRQWAAKPISTEESELFKACLKKSPIQYVVSHASYLINIASSDPTIHKKSVSALSEELRRCHQLDIPYLVLHPGSAGESNVQECLARIAHTLDHVLEQDTSHTMILLENMAGQGSSVCHTFEQLAEVRKLTHHKKRVGFCIDTCHAFAAGYDFRTEDTYEKLWTAFDTIIGIEHLKVFHINDSKKGLSSHVDRHEDIGKGLIGNQGFELLFNDPRFFDIPKILETPKESIEEDARNMETIRNLISPKNRKALGMIG